jgi:hypothetical protein
MPYTGTQAQSGLGTVLAINTGTSGSPTWTTIGEVVDLTQSSYQNESDDATNLQSSAREFIATILNPGTWEMTINRVSSDAGQTALLSNFNSRANVMFKITLPKTATQVTSGDSYAFTAMVEKYGESIKADKKISISASLKVSNAITLTVGS